RASPRAEVRRRPRAHKRMTTIDARGNLHDGAGRFADKRRSAPRGILLDPPSFVVETASGERHVYDVPHATYALQTHEYRHPDDPATRITREGDHRDTVTVFEFCGGQYPLSALEMMGLD